MTKPKLRWYQLRLRTIVIGIGIVAIGLAFWRSSAAPYLEQFRIAQRIKLAGGVVESREGPALLKLILGEEKCQDITLVNLADIDPDEELLAAISTLPQLEVLVLSGLEITDDALQFVPRCESLQAVILDSTLVSDRALDSLRDARPGLHINRCDRRAMKVWQVTTANSSSSPPQHVANRLSPQFFLVAADISTRRPYEAQMAWLPTFHGLQNLQIDAFRLAEGIDRSTFAAIAQLRSLRRLELESHVAGYPEFKRDVTVPADDLSLLLELTQLESLTLLGLPVDDEFVRALHDFAHLKHLNLSETLVQDPDSWPAMSLETLILNNTFIDNDDLAAIARFEGITELSLKFTEITDERLSDLLPLQHLQTLHVAGTRMTKHSYDVLCKFPRLNAVALASVPVEWPRFPAPRLDFSHPRRTWYAPFGPIDNSFRSRDEIEPQAFDRHTYAPDDAADQETLRDLEEDLRFRSIDADPLLSLNLNLLAGRSTIESLDLSETFVWDADLPTIGTLPNLERLQLNESWVSDAGLSSLSQCPRLKYLDLSGTSVTDEGLEALAKIETLEWLVLPAQLVRGPGLKQLQKLPHLYHVSFEWPEWREGRTRNAAPLTADEVAQFRELARYLLGKFDATADGVVHVGEAWQYISDFFETHSSLLPAPAEDANNDGILSIDEVLHELLKNQRVEEGSAN